MLLCTILYHEGVTLDKMNYRCKHCKKREDHWTAVFDETHPHIETKNLVKWRGALPPNGSCEACRQRCSAFIIMGTLAVLKVAIPVLTVEGDHADIACANVTPHPEHRHSEVAPDQCWMRRRRAISICSVSIGVSNGLLIWRLIPALRSRRQPNFNVACSCCGLW